MRLIAVASFVYALVLGLWTSPAPAASRAQAEVQTFRAQSQAEADAKSTGCVTCHTATDEKTMHPTGTVHLGCVDCHGGNATATTKAEGHPKPTVAGLWPTSANPIRAYTAWLR